MFHNKEREKIVCNLSNYKCIDAKEKEKLPFIILYLTLHISGVGLFYVPS